MLQMRERGGYWGGLNANPPSPQTPLYSLGRFQPFALWIKHLERIQDRLLRVSACGQHIHDHWKQRKKQPGRASCFPQPPYEVHWDLEGEGILPEC